MRGGLRPILSTRLREGVKRRLMAYQSKTYSLSDEVVAAIDAARARGLTPNKFLLHLLAVEQTAMTKPDDLRINSTQRPTRSLREKGDGKR